MITLRREGFQHSKWHYNGEMAPLRAHETYDMILITASWLLRDVEHVAVRKWVAWISAGQHFFSHDDDIPTVHTGGDGSFTRLLCERL
jgi:hypothetical protein